MTFTFKPEQPDGTPGPARTVPGWQDRPVDKCTNCGTPIEPVDPDEYESRLSRFVSQTGDYPSSGLRVDVKREDGTVVEAWLGPLESSTEFDCPRCGKRNRTGGP